MVSRMGYLLSQPCCINGVLVRSIAAIFALVAVIGSGCTEDKPDPSAESESPTDTAEGEDTSDSGEPTAEETGDPPPAEPTLWNGPAITFTKADGADPADPANQDALTDLVILTRGDRGSLFNAVTETAATSSSPAGTEWAQGTTDALDGLTFAPLKAAANNNMRNVPGTAFVLHLIDEDIYIDVTFLTWTPGNSGGGFSYERSTPDE